MSRTYVYIILYDIDDVKDGKWFDMIVLDVVLKNENGVDIAKELRECGYKGKIAFWTAH